MDFPSEEVNAKLGMAFLFMSDLRKKVAINEAPIIIVTGKTHFEIGHAPKDQSKWRKNLPGYAAWEIHPVMKIEVQ